MKRRARSTGDDTPRWVIVAMRAGFAARGIVFLLVGGLAIYGAEAHGLRGSLAALEGGALSVPALGVISAGLFAYALWCLAAAWLDVQRFGGGLYGLAGRAVIAVMGLAHGALGGFALHLALLVEDYQVERLAETAPRIGWFLDQPYGWPLVVAVGLGVAGSGLAFVYKAFTPAFWVQLRRTSVNRFLAPVGRIGLLAYGTVLCLVGVFVAQAGWTTDAAELGGFREAFAYVESRAHGERWLTALGAGVVGFAVFCFVQAGWRGVPGETVPIRNERPDAASSSATRREDAMADIAPGWVVPVMRAGYAARAVVYVLIGLVLLFEARTTGPEGALATLRSEPWGTPALYAIGVGLFAYALWRLIAAWMDLERHGRGAKGIVARVGLVVTGLLHVGLGVAAVTLAAGGGGGGDSKQTATAWLLNQPFGRWLVMAAGAIVIGAGIYYGYKGISGKYKEHLAPSRLAERLTPAAVAGLLAHGVVIVIIGGFLVWAGWSHDSSDAGGLGQAFQYVREQPYGQWGIAALGVGMIGFAVYCAIEACYRVVPARSEDGVSTLASRARAEARRAAAQAG
ncbi:MAG: DUF1206 domain-containing protein [Paracoccaceae bacterium]